MKKKSWVSFFIFFCVFFSLNAQSVEFSRSNFKGKKGFSKAYMFFLDGIDAYEQNIFYEAIENFEKAYEFNPDNAELNFMLGDCYLHTIYKSKALKFLKRAVELDPEINDKIFYKLAQAYQYNYKFKEAKKEYYHFKMSMNPEELYLWDSLIIKKMNECDVGIMLMANPVSGMVVNLKDINSEYSDYSPIITGDGEVLYFTSRRKGSSENKLDIYDMQFFEDIYYSTKKGYKWQSPKNLGFPINTKYHDATVGMSIDGNILFIYRGEKNGGDIYFSVKKDTMWSTPKALPNPINTSFHENSASLAFDNRTLYFVSDRPGGYGGKDIYVAVMNDDSTWSNPVNLGSVINTKYDEDGVFIHPDNKTLFFSSKGHKTMGGYDIFFSVKDKTGEWTTPQNMGYPINTPDDDIFFVTTANGNQGFYTSIRSDGTGMKDIFVINFSTTEDDERGSKLTFLQGKVTNKDSLPIAANIKLYDLETNKHIGSYFSNKATGYFAVSLPNGYKYGLVFEGSEGNMPIFMIIDNKEKYGYEELNKVLVMDSDYAEYDIEVSDGSISLVSIPIVKALANFLKENSYNTYILQGSEKIISVVSSFVKKEGVTNVETKIDEQNKLVVKLKENE